MSDSPTPDQKWPCDKFVIHEAHQSWDGKFMCMGVTNDEYVRLTMPSNQGASIFADVAEQKCSSNEVHIPHLWQLTETSSFFRCMGVPLKTKDPRVKYCMKNEAHVSHHWPVSGMGGDDPVEYFCPGKNSKPPVKTKMKCGEFAPHLPHTWEENHTLYECEGDMGEEPETVVLLCTKKNTRHRPHHWSGNETKYWCRGLGYSPDDAREEKCSAAMVHNSHLWGSGKDTETVWCPGSSEQYTQDCGKRYIHQSHMWKVEEDYPDGPYGGLEVRCPGWQAVDGIPLPAITQEVTDNASGQLQKLADKIGELPSGSLELNMVAPPKWVYHVETRAFIGGPDQYHIVRKSEGYTKGQTIAKYENAVYARIVADALNGGVLLGFEVGE